jgi:hypothetical protein
MPMGTSGRVSRNDSAATATVCSNSDPP